MQKQQQRSPNLLDNEIYLDTFIIIIIMCDVHFHFFIHNIFITNSNESKMRENKLPHIFAMNLKSRLSWK